LNLPGKEGWACTLTKHLLAEMKTCHGKITEPKRMVPARRGENVFRERQTFRYGLGAWLAGSFPGVRANAD
jgi:hypothetical protein